MLSSSRSSSSLTSGRYVCRDTPERHGGGKKNAARGEGVVAAEISRDTLLPPTNRLSPSWISLRRILTKILSLAASSGSSLPSAEDQLADRQTTGSDREQADLADLTELDQTRGGSYLSLLSTLAKISHFKASTSTASSCNTTKQKEPGKASLKLKLKPKLRRKRRSDRKSPPGCTPAGPGPF